MLLLRQILTAVKYYFWKYPLLWDFDPGSWVVKWLAGSLYDTFILECCLNPAMDPLASGMAVCRTRGVYVPHYFNQAEKMKNENTLMVKPFRSTSG